MRDTAYFAHNPLHNCYDRASTPDAFDAPGEGVRRSDLKRVEFQYGPTFEADRCASDDELAKLDPQFRR